MKQISYEDILKAFNECVLGRDNEYYPKLALTFDHDGNPMFLLINYGEDGESEKRASIIEYRDVAYQLNSMSGYTKYGVANGDDHLPFFVELDI